METEKLGYSKCLPILTLHAMCSTMEKVLERSHVPQQFITKLMLAGHIKNASVPLFTALSQCCFLVGTTPQCLSYLLDFMQYTESDLQTHSFEFGGNSGFSTSIPSEDEGKGIVIISCDPVRDLRARTQFVFLTLPSVSCPQTSSLSHTSPFISVLISNHHT